MGSKLAIDGGAPVRRQLLPYARQTVDEADVAAVVAVLRSPWLTTGPAVAEYENAFAEYVGAEHAVAVTSGTAALHLAAEAVGIGCGDEVLVPPLTFAATANCVLYCGGRPAFVDIEPETCLLNPTHLEAKITEDAKAVIAVDYAGQPADMDAVNEIAKHHNLAVIEDAAHALGATYKNRPVGTLADITVFSTHPVKPIATGEGGMVVTDHADLAARIRSLRNHGIASDAAVRCDWRYEMTQLGYNYRMPDILCALGRSQLEKANEWLARRRSIAARYDKAFASLPEIEPVRQEDDRASAWHLYAVRLNLDRLCADRGRVFQALRAEGIGVNVHYIPVYWHPYYENLGYRRGLCPLAEAQYERLLTLPLWAGMSDRDAEDVVEAVRKVVAAYAA